MDTNYQSLKNTPTVLSVIFSRLYTFRNQTIHGGVTWSFAIKREQMREVVSFLSKSVPFIN